MSEQDSKPGADSPEPSKSAPTSEGQKGAGGDRSTKKKGPPAKTKTAAKDSSGAASGGAQSAKTAPSNPASAQGGSGGAKPTPPKERSSRGRAGLWLGLLALLIAVLAILGGAYLWQQQQQLRASVQEQQSELARTADTLRSDWSSSSETLQRRADSLGQAQQQLRESVESVRELAGRSRRDWILAEVEYLLRIANQRLQLQRDVATAMAALQSADARLRELSDPGLTEVRQRIASELSELRATPRPDLDGMALQLNSLSEQVAQLPVKAARAPARTTTAQAAPVLEAEDWRQGLGRAWEALKRLVVIRRRDEPIAPLLGPEQEFAVREGLRLQLNGARLALLRQDPQLYDTSLQSAQEWLNRYFVTDDAATGAMADSLEQLGSRPVRVELPDISASLRLLRDIMTQRGVDTAPATDVDAAPAPSEGASEPAPSSPASTGEAPSGDDTGGAAGAEPDQATPAGEADAGSAPADVPPANADGAGQ